MVISRKVFKDFFPQEKFFCQIRVFSLFKVSKSWQQHSAKIAMALLVWNTSKTLLVIKSPGLTTCKAFLSRLHTQREALNSQLISIHFGTLPFLQIFSSPWGHHFLPSCSQDFCSWTGWEQLGKRQTSPWESCLPVFLPPQAAAVTVLWCSLAACYFLKIFWVI